MHVGVLYKESSSPNSQRERVYIASFIKGRGRTRAFRAFRAFRTEGSDEAC